MNFDTQNINRFKVGIFAKGSLMGIYNNTFIFVSLLSKSLTYSLFFDRTSMSNLVLHLRVAVW